MWKCAGQSDDLNLIEIGDHFKLKKCSSTYPSCSKSNPSQTNQKKEKSIYWCHLFCCIRIVFYVLLNYGVEMMQAET